MNAAIFFMSIIVVLICLKKTIDYSIVGWLGFCMRGGAIGKESVRAIAWLAFQGFLVYLAVQHVPFTMSWR